MAAKPATSYDQMKDLLEVIAERHISQERTLITARSMQTHFKIELDKEISIATIREYGVSIDGYFVKKYPRVFSYQKQGDPKNWGLVMKTEKFLKDVRDYSEEEIEKLKPKKQEVEAA